MSDELTITNREQYLAQNPAIRKVQEAYFADMNRGYVKAMKDKSAKEKHEISGMNWMRRVGEAMIGFLNEADIPGKQLTFDIHQQIFGGGKKQLNIPFDFSQACIILSENQETDITTIEEARDCYKQLSEVRMAFWDEAKSVRPPQERALVLDEWGNWLAWIKKLNPVETIPKLMANENYFPDGHIRPDLRERYAGEWKPVFEVMDKFRKELGI